MPDRPPRLGDVIDDYCPRCRLLLNHDVASMAGDVVAKVTCRTCHNTHDYRHGQTPARRKSRKPETKSLMDQVLAGIPMPQSPTPPPAAAAEQPPVPLRKKRDLWAELERIRKK